MRVPRAGPVVLRAGIVCCLLLAAVVLAADAGEYPAFTRAGMRALVRGSLPLLAIAALHLVALDTPAWLRPPARRAALGCALTIDVFIALAAARTIRRGAPPMVGLTLAVAIVLAVGVTLLLRTPGRTRLR